jgi:hypothetical protein
MNENEIVDQFVFKTRKFTISMGQFKNEGTEFLQLNELYAIETKASNHFSMTDSTYEKSKPLVFATRSKQDPEIQVSMQYEGLPMEILNRFIAFVENRWQKNV